MNLKTIAFAIAILLVGGILIYQLSGKKKTNQNQEISLTAKKEPFEITVTATGELKARRSEKIRAPRNMRSAGIWQTTITDLITEGTIVEEGDYVATLDRTEIGTKMQDIQNEIDKIQTQLDQVKIDTAINMRQSRDQLVNLKYAMAERKLQVEQSKYEPQMVIRQAEIEMEKTKRDYDQLLTNLKLKQVQAEARVSEIKANFKGARLRLKKLSDLSDQFVINAPMSGMVIYSRRTSVGSQINSWNNVVATLPDLTDMISVTYVNEVDVAKVSEGQEVRIKVDAFPDNEYLGKVTQVANIGEQYRNYDAKVFEVVVQMMEMDSILRPAMTTSNQIVTEEFENVITIPVEALHSDSINYVFSRTGSRVQRQEVLTSWSSTDKVIIEHGIAEGDEILLSIPDDFEEMKFQYLDPAIKAEKQKLLAQEKKIRIEKMQAKLKDVKSLKPPRKQAEGGGGSVIFFGN